MKTDGTYTNGQIIKEQKGDTLTFYHKDGAIKAQGKCIDGLFEGRWEFFKKEGFLWNVGHFKHNQKHGQWTLYNPDGSVKKGEVYEMGKRIKEEA